MSGSSSELRFLCPQCGQHLTADVALSGRLIACPHCRAGLTVPGLEGEEWQSGQVLDGLYEVQRKLGQGGMGTVWLVYHRHWGIELAVKSPSRAGLQLAGGPERYIREAETWVRLRLHPHVVQAFYVRELGGVPRVFAEYCPQGSLADRLKASGPPPLAEALDWGVQICWGMSHAHREQLIHCDLKPGNVLVAADGTLKVTDFGLARRGAGVTTEDGITTGVAAKVSMGFGTPGYAAPEQGREGGRVDLRADVFAFGATLWELLGGPLAWEDRSVVAQRSVQQMLDRGEVPGLPPALGKLIAQCLAREPEQRCANLEVVAEQLQAVYRETTGQAYPRTEPRSAEFVADTLNNQAISLLDLGQPDAAARLWEEAVRQQPGYREATFNLGLWRWRHGHQTDQALLEALQTPAWRDLRAAVHLERGDAAGAAAEGAEVGAEVGTRLLGTWNVPNEQLTAVAFAPDGGSLLIGTRLGRLYVLELASGSAPQLLFSRDQQHEVRLISFLADGRAVVAFGRGLVVVWHGERGDRLQEHHVSLTTVHGLYLSDNGLLCASDDAGNVAGLPLHAATPVLTRLEWARYRASAVATLAQDQTLLVGHEQRLETFALATGQPLAGVDCTAPSCSVAVAPDQLTAVTGHADGQVVCWEVPELNERRVLAGHAGPVRALGWLSGTTLASGGDDGAVRLWNVTTGVCLRTLDEPTAGVNALALTRDGAYLAAGGADGVVRVWQVAPEPLATAAYLVAHPRSAAEVGQQEDRFQRALAAVERESVLPAQYRRLREAMTVPGYERAPAAMRLLGDLAAYGCPRGLRDAWERRDLIGAQIAANGVAISSDGCFGLSAGTDRIPRRWDLATGQCVGVMPPAEVTITAVAWSADGRYCAFGDQAGGLRLHEAASGECLADTRLARGALVAVVFAPHGRWLAAVDQRGQVFFARTPEGTRWSSGQCSTELFCLAASPTGELVAAGARGGGLSLWAPGGPRPILTFAGHGADARAVSFSPGGGYVLAGDTGGMVTLWHLASGKEVLRWSASELAIAHVSFLAGGRFVVVGGGNGHIGVWELVGKEWPEEAHLLGEVRLQSGALGALALADGGTLGLAANRPQGLSVIEWDWDLDLPEEPDPQWRRSRLPQDEYQRQVSAMTLFWGQLQEFGSRVLEHSHRLVMAALGTVALVFLLMVLWPLYWGYRAPLGEIQGGLGMNRAWWPAVATFMDRPDLVRASGQEYEEALRDTRYADMAGLAYPQLQGARASVEKMLARGDRRALVRILQRATFPEVRMIVAATTAYDRQVDVAKVARPVLEVASKDADERIATWAREQVRVMEGVEAIEKAVTRNWVVMVAEFHSGQDLNSYPLTYRLVRTVSGPTNQNLLEAGMQFTKEDSTQRRDANGQLTETAVVVQTYTSGDPRRDINPMWWRTVYFGALARYDWRATGEWPKPASETSKSGAGRKSR